jgi:hypothetical protein
MGRFAVAAALGILGLILLVEAGASQDKKDKDGPKIKGMLPPGWKGLMLEADQIQKIYAAQKAFRGKIAALEDQILDLRAQERVEMVKVLNAEQKELLKKITFGEEGKDKDKGPEKKGKKPPEDKVVDK